MHITFFLFLIYEHYTGEKSRRLLRRKFGWWGRESDYRLNHETLKHSLLISIKIMGEYLFRAKKHKKRVERTLISEKIPLIINKISTAFCFSSHSLQNSLKHITQFKDIFKSARGKRENWSQESPRRVLKGDVRINFRKIENVGYKSARVFFKNIKWWSNSMISL